MSPEFDILHSVTSALPPLSCLFSMLRICRKVMSIVFSNVLRCLPFPSSPRAPTLRSFCGFCFSFEAQGLNGVIVPYVVRHMAPGVECCRQIHITDTLCLSVAFIHTEFCSIALSDLLSIGLGKRLRTLVEEAQSMFFFFKIQLLPPVFPL